MKEIILTRGQTTLLDDVDYEKFSAFKWNVILRHGKWYAKRVEREYPYSRTIYLHREILGITDPKIQVDHQDGNGLNNQRYNLRECNHSQNLHNSSKRVNNTSGFKGVTLQKGKWIATIRSNGKHTYLGQFGSPEDAAKAYDEAALKYYGEFANLNFPELREKSS
jgi:hypothetical protein